MEKIILKINLFNEISARGLAEELKSNQWIDFYPNVNANIWDGFLTFEEDTPQEQLNALNETISKYGEIEN